MSFLDLDDHLVHCVMSLLTFKDLIRFRSTSTRSKDLVDSLPYLIIDSQEIGWESQKRDNFNKFLSGFLKNEGKRKRKVLDLRWMINIHNFNEEIIWIHRWLQGAIQSNLKKIILDFTPTSLNQRLVILPNHVYECKSLEHLSVKWILLQFPDNAHLSSLQFLSLYWITIQFQNFGEWIDRSCPRLKELILFSVHGIRVLSLGSSSLERLSIYKYKDDHLCHVKILAAGLKKLFLLLYNRSSDDSSVRISAPNLSSLNLDGDIAGRYVLGSFRNLTSATIYRGKNPFISSRNFPAMEENLIDILGSIRHASSLTSTGNFLQSLMERRMLSKWKNVVRLHLFTTKDCKFSTIASLINQFPRLTSLTVTCNKLRDLWAAGSCDGTSDEEFKFQVPQVIVDLENVRMEHHERIIDQDLSKYLISLGFSVTGSTF